MKQKWINILLNVSRIIFGLTFLFSGFVKAVDPMGSAYKFIDYFRAFDLTFLNTFAVPLSVLLAALEFTIGACILFGCYRKLASLAGLLFMCFFTPLTLYLAIANPVKDCGCFGEALVLTNWETFYKNIVLLAMSIFIFTHRQELNPLFVKGLRWIVTLYAFVFCIIISQIGLSYLPILNFRPFKNGVNIQQEMKGDQIDASYLLVYQKDGKTQEFTLDNYPADDSTWVFVETRTILPEGTKEASIKDFFLTNDFGEDITQEILDQPGYTFLLISPDLALADNTNSDRINEIYEYALEKGYHFYGVSVNDPQQITEWTEGTGAEYPFIFSDATILETVIRANPGIVLLHQGTIILKKNWSHLPDDVSLDESIQQAETGIIKKSNARVIILFSILIFFGPILVLLCFEKTILILIRKLKKKKD